MPLRCFRPLLWQYIVILVLPTAIALFGCSNDDDNVTSQDVEGLTFIFDSSFIDNDLNGLTTCLVFGTPSATDENDVPFEMTFQDTVTSQGAERCLGQVVAKFSGPADVGSIQLQIETINDDPDVDSIVVFNGFNDDVTFNVGETIRFDVNVHEEDDGTHEFTFTNDRGNDLTFRFEIGATSAAASPDSG